MGDFGGEMPDLTSPGEDFYRALADAFAEAEDADAASLALDSVGVHDWRHLGADVRAVFEVAALRFLSE